MLYADSVDLEHPGYPACSFAPRWLGPERSGAWPSSCFGCSGMIYAVVNISFGSELSFRDAGIVQASRQCHYLCANCLYSLKQATHNCESGTEGSSNSFSERSSRILPDDGLQSVSHSITMAAVLASICAVEKALV